MYFNFSVVLLSSTYNLFCKRTDTEMLLPITPYADFLKSLSDVSSIQRYHSNCSSLGALTFVYSTTHLSKVQKKKKKSATEPYLQTVTTDSMSPINTSGHTMLLSNSLKIHFSNLCLLRVKKIRKIMCFFPCIWKVVSTIPELQS